MDCLQVGKKFGNGNITVCDEMAIKVLITDAEYKNTLSCMRSLSKKGYYVGSVSTSSAFRTLGFYSKYCEEKFIMKVDKDNIDEYAKELLRLIEREKYDVLIPVGLKSCLAVSKYREKFLDKISCTIPDWDRMKIAYNKDQSMRLAKKIGVPIPDTKVLYDKKDLKTVTSFPVVIKSSDQATISVKYCNNKKELLNNFIYLKKKSKTNIIAQEYIRGFGSGFYGVYKDGKMLSYFMHKRVKEFPITGGPSAVAKSYFDDRVLEYGKKIADSLAWNGPLMVEFKYDSKNDDFKLMEINPKLWGSLDLTIESGVDVPYMLVQLALGKRIRYNGYTDITFRWIFPSEFLALLSHFSYKNLRDFLTFGGNIKTNLYPDDLRPFIFNMFLGIYNGFRVLTNEKYRYPHGRAKRK